MLKTIGVVILSILIVNASCWLSRDQYEEIKKVATWEVLPYETFLELFGNKTFEDMSSRVGQEIHSSEKDSFLKEDETVRLVSDAVLGDPAPVNAYDPRTKYPNCFKPPRQQGNCGSCYSFAIGMAFESRICIKSKNQILIELAPQYIVSCDSSNMKCRGGLLVESWRFLENTGIVSERCFPYVSGQSGYIPACPSKCVNSLDQFYALKANYNTYRSFTTIQAIKQELYDNGPLSTGMRTFEDFSAYRGGVYQYAWGRETDPHAVIIVGYGVDGSTPYWLIRNSWGTQWGENGYFRIVMNSVNAPEGRAGASSVPILG